MALAEELRKKKRVWKQRVIWTGSLEWVEQEWFYGAPGKGRKTREYCCKLYSDILGRQTELTAARNPNKLTVEFLEQDILLGGVDIDGDDFFRLGIKMRGDRDHFLAKYMRSFYRVGLIEFRTHYPGHALGNKYVLLVRGGQSGLTLQARVPKNRDLWSERIQKWRNAREGIPNPPMQLQQALPNSNCQNQNANPNQNQPEENVANEAEGHQEDEIQEDAANPDPGPDRDNLNPQPNQAEGRAPVVVPFRRVEGGLANPPQPAALGEERRLNPLERNDNQIMVNRVPGFAFAPHPPRPGLAPFGHGRVVNLDNQHVGLVLPRAILDRYRPRVFFHDIMQPRTQLRHQWDEAVEHCVMDQLDMYS